MTWDGETYCKLTASQREKARACYEQGRKDGRSDSYNPPSEAYGTQARSEYDLGFYLTWHATHSQDDSNV